MKIVPKYPYSDGADAVALCETVNFVLDQWQCDVLDTWLARNKYDRFANQSCGLAVPRQNGKNAIIEAFEIYTMITQGAKILHTAHEVKTARKAFLRLKSFFDETSPYPEFRELVKEIRKTNGQECIALKTGGLVEYSARTRGAHRGDSMNTVIFDEAQELGDEQMEAMLPALSASDPSKRLIIYTGTPPGPTARADVFLRVRDSILSGKKKHATWHEWGATEIGDITDKKRWYECNPALGVRITEEAIDEELHTMSVDGFARERLGYFAPERSATTKIDITTWAKAGIEEPRLLDGKLAYGVKFAPDASETSLCACRYDDGEAHVELIAKSDGVLVDWLVDYLNDEDKISKTASIAIDGRRGADNLLNRLMGVYPRQALMSPGTKGVIEAASMFDAALKEGHLTHLKSEKQAPLDESALKATERQIGRDGGWSYGGENSSAIEAATLAYWAARTTRREPDGGCMIF